MTPGRWSDKVEPKPGTPALGSPAPAATPGARRGRAAAVITRGPLSQGEAGEEWPDLLRDGLPRVYAQICLLRISLLRFVDSRFPGNPLWVWEFHSLNLRSCLSQTL